MSETAKTKNKSESLERLQNQYEQAKTSGDTALAKKIKAVIDRVKGDKGKQSFTAPKSK